MKAWLRGKLREWIGVDKQEIRINNLDSLYKDLASIGVDVHFREPHMILIYSRLNGGQIREVRADFTNMKELEDFVRELKSRYNTSHVVSDLPHGMGRDFFRF
jgi:hypothetical protein